MLELVCENSSKEMINCNIPKKDLKKAITDLQKNMTGLKNKDKAISRYTLDIL